MLLYELNRELTTLDADGNGRVLVRTGEREPIEAIKVALEGSDMVLAVPTPVQLQRFLVTPERVDGRWEFESYRTVVLDSSDFEGAGQAYGFLVELPQFWPEDEPRPNTVRVAPMLRVGMLEAAARETPVLSGPQNKHRAEAFRELWDLANSRTVGVKYSDGK